MNLEHDIQKQVILKLIHNPELGFNELWAKQGESNAFAYHVNKLESLGLISKKENGKYSLTLEGKKACAFVEGDTGGRAEFPTLTVVMLVWDGDKLLCQRRLKEPYYGYWGFISGKINFGQNLFECATRDLLEESGLNATDWKFKGIEQVKTFEGSELLHHHYLMLVETRAASGALKEKTHKAEHAWLTPSEYKSKESFPKEWFFAHILPAKQPLLLEVERYMKDGKFVGAKTVSVLGL